MEAKPQTQDGLATLEHVNFALKNWQNPSRLAASPLLEYVAVSMDPSIRLRPANERANALRAWLLTCLETLVIHVGEKKAKHYAHLIRERYISERSPKDELFMWYSRI